MFLTDCFRTLITSDDYQPCIYFWFWFGISVVLMLSTSLLYFLVFIKRHNFVIPDYPFIFVILLLQ